MSKEISTVILNHLKESLRPFSANDIVEKYGKEHGKSMIIKSIEKLVSKESIVEKTFGKQKIYFFKDDKYKKKNAAEVTALETALQKLNDDLKMKQNEIKRYSNEILQIHKLPSIQQLETERDKLQYKVDANIEKLDRIKYLQSSQTTTLKPEQIIKIERNHEKITGLFRKRKRICAEMIDAILEGYPKTKKHLIEEIGIETDENVGFNINN